MQQNGKLFNFLKFLFQSIGCHTHKNTSLDNMRIWIQLSLTRSETTSIHSILQHYSCSTCSFWQPVQLSEPSRLVHRHTEAMTTQAQDCLSIIGRPPTNSISQTPSFAPVSWPWPDNPDIWKWNRRYSWTSEMNFRDQGFQQWGVLSKQINWPRHICRLQMRLLTYLKTERDRCDWKHANSQVAKTAGRQQVL